METMPAESAPASNASSSCVRGTPPEEVERNNAMQRSEANLALAGSLGGGGDGGGTPRNVVELFHRRIAWISANKACLLPAPYRKTSHVFYT
jgi:hypothetical protein